MSRLAVVIPLYNHAAYIGPALESVYDQTRPPDRVIVIDDGSSDDSFSVAKKLARSGTELVRQENSGAHATLNRGVEMAGDCERVAILNSDDVWHPTRLARCEAALAGKSAVSTGLHLIDSAGETLADDAPKMRRNLTVWAAVARENDPLVSLGISNFAKTTSNLVADRQFLLRHPFQSYRYVHDYHFFLQAALVGELAVVPDDLLGYRVHETNTIKADGRRAVVAETVQMHLDLMGQIAEQLRTSSALRGRFLAYLRKVMGNHTDFRAEVFLQVLAEAIQRSPAEFPVSALPDLEEFERKSEPFPY